MNVEILSSLKITAPFVPKSLHPLRIEIFAPLMV